MTASPDPAGLGPVERRREIARILALGYLRIAAARNPCLELSADREPDARAVDDEARWAYALSADKEGR